MMRIGRMIAAISLCLPLMTTVPAQATPLGTQKVAWRPCAQNPKVQCGTVDVPIDWSKPGAARIRLALARRPALDPARRIGALLINPGGPGGSGVDFALFADEAFSPVLLQRFDIVGFDPRGIGGSHPVMCPELRDPPTSHPSDAEEFRRLLAFNERRARECRKLTGPLFDHVDTVNVVRDMDAIRGALGERDISYYGVSYGTLIGQQYAELFPRRVRALVLDSNMDHSLTSARRYAVTETRALEESYGRFAAWCGTSTQCVIRKPGAIPVLDELMARADRGRLDDPDDPGTKIRPEQLSERLLAGMYGPGAWPELGAELARLRSGTPAARATPGKPTEDPYQAIFCADFDLPVRDHGDLRRLAAAARRAAPHTRVSSLGWTDVTGCQRYLPRASNRQRPYRIKGTPPILMTNGRYDVATPYPWATNAARQIPDAVLLTYDGVGHGSYRLSTCAARAIDHYLLTVRTPPRGTHCPVEPPTTSHPRRSAPETTWAHPHSP